MSLDGFWPSQSRYNLRLEPTPWFCKPRVTARPACPVGRATFFGAYHPAVRATGEGDGRKASRNVDEGEPWPPTAET